jgi:hypothetical protein
LVLDLAPLREPEVKEPNQERKGDGEGGEERLKKNPEDGEEERVVRIKRKKKKAGGRPRDAKGEAGRGRVRGGARRAKPRTRSTGHAIEVDKDGAYSAAPVLRGPGIAAPLDSRRRPVYAVAPINAPTRRPWRYWGVDLGHETPDPRLFVVVAIVLSAAAALSLIAGAGFLIELARRKVHRHMFWPGAVLTWLFAIWVVRRMVRSWRRILDARGTPPVSG